jgi:putative ABC transport system ATP-binding protein
VTQPLIVLADEPTGALDSRNAAMVMEVFAGLGSLENAVVLVTHDLEVAATANRVVHMRDGEIVADDAQTAAPFASRT